jgi:phospholipid/cholesterol/gamma-HCH transport system substrate-binding protein
MKSTKNTRAVTVGIFIFVGLLIFIIGVLTLGGQKKTFSNSIQVRAIFNDVNGLQAGNNIWFAGVKIGTVKSIKFNPDSKVQVDMDIDEKTQQYIRHDAKAKIGTDGLIGNKIVVLYGGTPQAPPIKDGDQVGVENALGMDEVMNTLQANNKNLLDITDNFKVISQRLAAGEGSIGKLLKDETLSNQMETVLASLHKATSNAELLTNNLTAYTSKLQRKGSLANDIVTDTVVFSRLRASVAQIEEISKSANDVMGSLKATTGNLNSSLNSNTSPAGVLLHDEETANNLKATIKNLQTSTEKLDENMEALQHNFLFRGFFKKKAKQKQETPTKPETNAYSNQ